MRKESAPAHPEPVDLPAVQAAYRAETRRLIAERYPISTAIFLALMASAYIIEWLYFPGRWWQLTLCYFAFVAITAVCTLLLRRHPRQAIALTLASSVAIAFALAAYLGMVHRSAELCLLGMIGLLTGEVVQFPWGVRGQVIATAGVVAAYLWALDSGAVLTLPAPYGLFALASHGVMTLIGAHLLDSYRFAAYRQAAEAAHHAAASARANAAKGEFLATVSHELRTPLHIIVGYTDLLLERAFARPEEQIDVLRRVQDNSRQLLDLIQSMLDLNRIEANGIVLRVEEFPVAAALDNLRAGLPDTWCKPGVTVQWDGSAGATLVRTDRHKLEIILRNLIHNALKYTERGTVKIAAHADPTRNRVVFSVADTGQGIHASDLDVIFEMFRQASNGGPPRGGGVGLGLYIAKRLCEALSGEIRVESRPGAGSLFTVAIPIAPA